MPLARAGPPRVLAFVAWMERGGRCGTHTVLVVVAALPLGVPWWPRDEGLAPGRDEQCRQGHTSLGDFLHKRLGLDGEYRL